MAEIEVFNALTELIGEIGIMQDLNGNDLGFTLVGVSLVLSFVFLLNNDLKNTFLSFLVGMIIVGTMSGTFIWLIFAVGAFAVLIVEFKPFIAGVGGLAKSLLKKREK